MSTQKRTPIYRANETADIWQTADDRVMGGISVAHIALRQVDGQTCQCLTGDVSLENRGGFVQMKWEMGKVFDASAFMGVYVTVLGNNEDYNLHIRTGQLWLPWQSFRAAFHAKNEWQTLFMPFSDFENYKTWSTLDPDGITKVAVVAIGRAFRADVCVREWGFYA